MKPVAFRLICILGLFLSFAACKKDNTVTVDPSVQAARDEALIEKYIKTDTISNAVRTSTGLYYAIRTTGTIPQVQVKAGNTVTVHYIGRFLNGEIFESSYKNGNPIIFTVGTGKMIKGWDEGIQLMKKGEKALLYIPSALAYGTTGSGSIPPNTVLKFEITVLDVK